MKAAVRSSSGLDGAHRWESRLLVACVCCARMYWSENLLRLHLVGPHAEWMCNPDRAWPLLAVDAYSARAPLIPRSELEASAVFVLEHLVLLHKRRCGQCALEGKIPAPWCHDCASSLGKKSPEMPRFALANHNWLGRLTKVQLKLLSQTYMGHRLLLTLAMDI